MAPRPNALIVFGVLISNDENISEEFGARFKSIHGLDFDEWLKGMGLSAFSAPSGFVIGHELLSKSEITELPYALPKIPLDTGIQIDILGKIGPLFPPEQTLKFTHLLIPRYV